MRRLLCCLTKPDASTSREADSDASTSRKADPDAPFGDNHLLNYAFKYKLDLPDDRNPPPGDRNPPELGPNQSPSSRTILLLPVFTFKWEEITEATEEFVRSHYLGRGNFGEVYRCDFPQTVGAVKFQDLDAALGHEEFVAEIKALHRADHPNVIKLLGKAFGPKIRGLVYEYMPKGSLDHILFAAAPRSDRALPQLRVTPGLTWNRRMKIAVGVAKGLDYIHTTLKVLHLDVKVGNVLLDQDFTPKLTDFGLSMKMAHDDAGEEIPRLVDPIKGTPGCIAPDSEESGLVSTKADVYSYGIFLLQLLTGSKSFDFSRPEQERKLADWLVPACTTEQNLLLMMDLKLGGRFPVEGMKRVFEAARMCINPQVHERPHMAFVESMIRDAAAFEVPE